MRKKSFIKDLYSLIPLIFSGLLCIISIFILWQKNSTVENFTETLTDVSTVFISISGFLAAIIMVFIAISVINLKNSRNSINNDLDQITQKMHHFRTIVEILLRSKIWLPGLKEYIDNEFEGLNFFEVKEFYKGKSKIAIEFLQEHPNYNETENLYLELKSLLMAHPKEKNIPENIAYPKVYSKNMVSKWLEHKCGSGLWYYFGYKFGIYKESLDINAVFERHQDQIMTLANKMDSEVFEDSSFNEVFLSKLGEYIVNDVLPKLYQFMDKTEEKLPSVYKYLYSISVFFVFFGVLIPLFYILFFLPVILLIISYSTILGLIFFITTTFYHFLSRDI